MLTDEVSENFAEALDWAGRKGLRWVEVRTVDGRSAVDLPDAELARAGAEIEKRGLRVSGVATSLFTGPLDPSADRGEAVELRLPRAIEAAKRLGTGRVRIYSFRREETPRKRFAEVVACLKRAAAVAEKAGALLLLENDPACNGGYAEEVANLVRAVDSPALRALWNPGNETFGGRVAYPEGYILLKGLFEHVRLGDCAADAEGIPFRVPVGRGRVPLGGLLRALERDGYRGPFTLESGGARGPEESLEGLETMLAQAGLS